MYPEELKYNKDHQWLKIEGNQVTIGITQYAQEQLGDIVFVELTEVGEELDEGDSFGTVESVKAVSEMYSPIAGKILAINEDLADSPEKINQDPYGDGWMITLEVSEVPSFLTALEYKSFVEEEAGE